MTLNVLGPPQLCLDGVAVELPRSKKCRALLAYLAVTGRAHRRDRLCDMFWDVADDPRGGLRWTLSRLRKVLPTGVMPIEADRTQVRIDLQKLSLDVSRLRLLGELSALDIGELEAAASTYRGEFLEGLELPDFLDFSAWVVAHREEFRRGYCDVLHELVDRLADDPSRCLPWARRLAQADAFGARAHEALLRQLINAGFEDEARIRYEHALRQFREVGAPEADSLERSWAALHRSPPPPVATRAQTAPAVQRRPRTLHSPVGRSSELQTVRQTLHEVSEAGRSHAVLVKAEPGGGKSHLLERARAEAASAGYAVFAARAFDLERGRPFGPWLDALDVASDELVEHAQTGGRARLFEQFSELVSSGSSETRGAVVVLDDVQWLDPDSSEVLIHLMHSYDAGPFLALLAARGGELADNAPMNRALSSFRRERALDELSLQPLTADEVGELIGDRDAAEAIAQASAGNPLYALELARGRAGDIEGPPRTLLELLRERVNRLSNDARDVLRWGAVLGYVFDAEQLESITDMSQLDLVDALEELERHALLHIDPRRREGRYVFSHDVVREAVYSELSYPRRRLMHRKIAQVLNGRGSDPATAYAVARHASQGGEVVMGVTACIEAGRYALRTCANADAEALAKRGLHHAADLDEAARVEATLDLLHVQFSARAPDRERAADQVRALAERALDLGLTRAARIGFQMLSFLRWESSSMADAHANILQAERVSRSADPAERTQALAHAARCLVLLEKNLGQAEAFALEASGLSERDGRSSAAVSFALAMIAAHRGEPDIADAAFREARDLARASGERLAEFLAIEHRLMLMLDTQPTAQSLELADALVDLGARVRPGAEVAIAQALRALACLLVDPDSANVEELGRVTEELRVADAKYELSFVLTRWAQHTALNDQPDDARVLADDALAVAQAIGRVSEKAYATSILADLARRRRDDEALAEHLEQLASWAQGDLSAAARLRYESARSETSQ